MIVRTRMLRNIKEILQKLEKTDPKLRVEILNLRWRSETYAYFAEILDELIERKNREALRVGSR